jgi:cytochrome c-type biogenesis protein CcmH/NrfG
MTNESSRPGGTWSNREAYLLALVCLTVGLVAGYILHGSAPIAPMSASLASSGPGGAAPSTSGSMPSAESLQPLAAPLLVALKTDPKNFDTLTQLGNLYYDHQIYPEAIEYYTRALEVRPNQVNVRTDLGTAFWYSGFPQKAVAEYEKSLATEPTHPNTLFNLAIVQSEGLKDYGAAIATWEKLLKTNPQYPEKQRVLDLIEKARKQKS